MRPYFFKFKLHTCVILFISLIILLPALVFATTVYVKKIKTKITEAPSPRSKIIAVINPDIPLEIISKKGNFYHVKLPNNKKGWVFKFKVTTKKSTRKDGDEELFALLVGERKIKADEASTGGSIRGLNRISERDAKRRGIKPEHIQAVKNMENFKIGLKELELFQQEGRLGEYSEAE
tara:strand:- start:17998 stop:18531 length:534 start_codon:yes stop_codon:yes gene_type:complete